LQAKQIRSQPTVPSHASTPAQLLTFGEYPPARFDAIF
jgi:hypothetical protein